MQVNNDRLAHGGGAMIIQERLEEVMRGTLASMRSAFGAQPSDGSQA